MFRTLRTHLPALLAGQARWRFIALGVVALVIAGLEAFAASSVYVLVGLVAAPSAPVTLPIVGDLSDRTSGVDGAMLRIGVALAVAAFFAVKAVALIGRTYAQERLLANSGVAIGSNLLRGYLAMPYREHTRRSSGEMVRNTFAGAHAVIGQVVGPFVHFLAEVAVIVALLVVLLFTSPAATAIAAAVFLPSIWLLQARILPRLAAHGRRMQDSQTGTVQSVQESLGAIRDLKLLDRGDDFLSRYTAHQSEFARSQYVVQTLQALPRALIESAIIFTVVLVFVASLIIRNPLDEVLATLSLFAYAGLRLQSSLQIAVASFNQIRSGVAVLEDLTTDLNAGSDWRDEEAAARGQWLQLRERQRTDGFGPHAQGQLRNRASSRDLAVAATPAFTDVSFDRVAYAYGSGDAEVLTDITFTVPAGRFVGICGPTGGGKSTLVDLLVGLLQPTRGEVLVDGTPLGPRPFAWWSMLGVVSQQVYLTDATLRDNILFSDSEADEERLERCLRRAQLTDVVRKLPDGLDTIVGERGVRLSGGQRQRVAIARALYREPPVLVLDEGTSALDAATEASVVAALDELDHDRTLIAVAHRLSTLATADELLVIDQGRLVARGTHEELLETSAIFRTLAQ